MEDKAQEADEAQEKRRRNRGSVMGRGSTVSRASNGSDAMQQYLKDADGNNDDGEILKTKPIADVFEEATVLFCDLVGFTGKWFWALLPPEVLMRGLMILLCSSLVEHSRANRCLRSAGNSVQEL